MQSHLSNILYQMTRASDIQQVVFKVDELRPASLSNLEKEVTLEGFFGEGQVRVCLKLNRPEMPGAQTFGVIAFQAAKKTESAPTRADVVGGNLRRSLSQGVKVSSGAFWDFLLRCKELDHIPTFRVYQTHQCGSQTIFVLFSNDMPEFLFAGELSEQAPEGFALTSYVAI